jgi:beta-lactamase regulating signal transducer with metallopeptidase domain
MLAPVAAAQEQVARSVPAARVNHAIAENEAEPRATDAADTQAEQPSQELLAIEQANVSALAPVSNGKVKDSGSVRANATVPRGVGSSAADGPVGSGLLSIVRMMLSTLWLAASIAAVARLRRGAVAGARLLNVSGQCDDARVDAALAEARVRLDLQRVRIGVYVSPAVHCPMIWCWGSWFQGKGPKLLLPVEAVNGWSQEQWLPILCHELAHWKRRDHVSALVAELVCCVLPWQPLAWIAKRRMEQAAEEACDDWTVAAGHSPVDYAEALLGLVAQADPPLALAALRRSSGLANRVRHILSQAVPRPRLGRLWTAAALTLAILGVGVTAVCQRGVARADDPAQSAAAKPAKKSEDAKEPEPAETAKATEKPKESTPAKSGVAKPAAAMTTGALSTYTPGGPLKFPVNDPNATNEPETFTLTGKVLTTDGQPIAGAELSWDAAFRSSDNPNAWLPEQTIATARSRDDGTYEIKAQYVRKKLARQSLVVRAAGYGIRSQLNLNPPHPLEVRLDPSVGADRRLNLLSRRRTGSRRKGDGTADQPGKRHWQRRKLQRLAHGSTSPRSELRRAAGSLAGPGHHGC